MYTNAHNTFYIFVNLHWIFTYQLRNNFTTNKSIHVINIHTVITCIIISLNWLECIYQYTTNLKKKIFIHINIYFSKYKFIFLHACINLLPLRQSIYISGSFIHGKIMNIEWRIVRYFQYAIYWRKNIREYYSPLHHAAINVS